MKPILIAVLLTLGAAALAADAPKGASKASARFDAAVAAAKASPLDTTLRREAVSAAAALKVKPPIPKEAKRHFVMAATFQKEAKSAEDFSSAASHYNDALDLAPWWPEAHYNRSVALEAAGRLAAAKIELEMYLLSKPKDEEAVEARLYALDAKIAMAARPAPAPVAPPKSAIEGTWYVVWDPPQNYPLFAVTRKGDGFELSQTGTYCSTVWDVAITESSVSFSCMMNGTTAHIVYSLAMQGGELAGSSNNLGMGGRGTRAIRLTKRD